MRTLAAALLLLSAAPALAGPPPAKVGAWLAAANEANARGDTTARRLYASLAVKHSPRDVDALFLLARFESYDGDYDAAIRHLRRAVIHAPKYRDVELHLLRVLGWAGRYDEAYHIGDRLVADYPDWSDALVARGDVAVWGGRGADAEQFYRRALALSPGDTELEWKVLVALMEAGDATAVREFLETLPEEGDDRRRARLRQRYQIADANVRMDAAIGYTLTDPGDWASWSAGASVRVSEPAWVGLRIDWERREFGGGVALIDTTLAVPLSVALREGISLTLEGAATPRADFAPIGRAVVEFAHDPLDLFGYTLGYRYSVYERVTAHTFYPSIALHLAPFAIEPTLLVTATSDGQTSLTGRLKLIWHVTERGTLEAWGFLGTEPLEPTVALAFDAPLQAGLLFGVSQQVGPMSRLRFLYAYSTPVENLRGVGPRVEVRHTLALAFVQMLRVGRGGDP